MDEDTLNIASWKIRSEVNGPGSRFVLWLQGCPNSCEGCINPAYTSFATRTVMSISEIARIIIGTTAIDGVTFSGGEPMAQAGSLALLARMLQKADLSVVCYTGFTIEELRLRKDKYINDLLGQVDILIDGPFIKANAASLLWRGSSNQRLLFLSERYARLNNELPGSPCQVEFSIGSSGYETSGIWPEGLQERIEYILRSDL